MLLATALALLITGCSTDAYCSKQTGAAVVPKKKPSPIISSFLEFGQKKTVDAAKILWRRRNVTKTETQQTDQNGIACILLL